MRSVLALAIDPTDRGTSPAKTDPEELARAAMRSGDRRRALSVLMDAYGPAVLRYCERMLGDLERARDVRQIVFLQAYEGLGHFEGRSSLRTWLFGIARHRSLDAIKSARVRRHEPIDSTAPTRDDPSPSADVRALAVQRAIIECLQRLERGVREAVLLRCQDGFSFPELGRMLGARAGTIEARVRRGTQRLRRCLEHHEVRP